MQVLFLSGWLPFPADNGSKIRIFNLLRELSRQHELSLITFADPGADVNLDVLKSVCRVAGVLSKANFEPTSMKALVGFLSRAPRSVVDTHSPEMAQVISQELQRRPYDLVVASQLITEPYVERMQGVAKVFEEVETAVIREQYTRATQRLTRARAALTWAKTSSYLAQLIRQFDACTVVSAMEQQHVRTIVPDYQPLTIIPNGVDVESLKPGQAQTQPNTLIFNGALTFNANYDAMQFFLRDVWPHIRAQEGAATLKITGRTDGVDLRALPTTDGVTLTGYLTDIRPSLASAAVCVVPLRIGGGTRLKILEAMAIGTPIVSTSKGAEGLEVTPEEHLLIADEPAQFAAQTVRLLHDDALRARLASNARRLVEEKYSWRSIGAQFNQLLDSVVQARRTHA